MVSAPGSSRAIDQLRLVSSTTGAQITTPRPSPRLHDLAALLKIHQRNHQHEPKLPMIWRQTSPGHYEKGVFFLAQWVKFGSHYDRDGSFIGHRLKEVDRLPLSEVAGQHLENTFGRQDELFVVDGAPQVPYYLHDDGYPHVVTWDQTGDRIIAKSVRGITLSIPGSNIVEAAEWLPQILNWAISHQVDLNHGPCRIEVKSGLFVELAKSF